MIFLAAAPTSSLMPVWVMNPPWAPAPDYITPWATVALAILALVSAIYARRLWIEATKQFAESKRSTDLDIALRMLDTCDAPGLVEAERIVGALHREGTLTSLESFRTWFKSASEDQKSKAKEAISSVLTVYEHLGIVVRKAPAISDILVDYLCLRVPILFDSLRVIVQADRGIGPTAHCEFEGFAEACRAFAKQTRASRHSMDSPPPQ
jgi:hypothetical protein